MLSFGLILSNSYWVLILADCYVQAVVREHKSNILTHFLALNLLGLLLAGPQDQNFKIILAGQIRASKIYIKYE